VLLCNFGPDSKVGFFVNLRHSKFQSSCTPTRICALAALIGSAIHPSREKASVHFVSDESTLFSAFVALLQMHPFGCSPLVAELVSEVFRNEATRLLSWISAHLLPEARVRAIAQ
jgi:hypothetical protein